MLSGTLIAELNHPLGQGCALLTAILWAVALVLFKRSGDDISPMALNLFKTIVGLVLLVATIAVAVAAGFASLDALARHPARDIWLLVLSGVGGIAVADTIFLRALNQIGLGLISIVDCAYSPLVILSSWLILDEQLTAFQYVGAALIVAGVFTASQHKPPVNRTRGQILSGMALAVVAVGLMALCIVFPKRIIEDMPLLWSSALRQGAAGVALAVMVTLSPDRRAKWAVFRPARSWRFALPGAILGTYVCIVLWVAGFKYTDASVAGALNQTSVVFSALLAAVVLKEQFGRRQVAALVLSLVGVAIVTLSDGLLTAALGLAAFVGW